MKMEINFSNIVFSKYMISIPKNTRVQVLENIASGKENLRKALNQIGDDAYVVLRRLSEDELKKYSRESASTISSKYGTKKSSKNHRTSKTNLDLKHKKQIICKKNKPVSNEDTKISICMSKLVPMSSFLNISKNRKEDKSFQSPCINKSTLPISTKDSSTNKEENIENRALQDEKMKLKLIDLFGDDCPENPTISNKKRDPTTPNMKSSTVKKIIKAKNSQDNIENKHNKTEDEKMRCDVERRKGSLEKSNDRKTGEEPRCKGETKTEQKEKISHNNKHDNKRRSETGCKSEELYHSSSKEQKKTNKNEKKSRSKERDIDKKSGKSSRSNSKESKTNEKMYEKSDSKKESDTFDKMKEKSRSESKELDIVMNDDSYSSARYSTDDKTIGEEEIPPASPKKRGRPSKLIHKKEPVTPKTKIKPDVRMLWRKSIEAYDKLRCNEKSFKRSKIAATKKVSAILNTRTDSSDRSSSGSPITVRRHFVKDSSKSLKDTKKSNIDEISSKRKNSMNKSKKSELGNNNVNTEKSNVAQDFCDISSNSGTLMRKKSVSYENIFLEQNTPKMLSERQMFNNKETTPSISSEGSKLKRSSSAIDRSIAVSPEKNVIKRRKSVSNDSTSTNNLQLDRKTQTRRKSIGENLFASTSSDPLTSLSQKSISVSVENLETVKRRIFSPDRKDSKESIGKYVIPKRRHSSVQQNSPPPRRTSILEDNIEKELEHIFQSSTPKRRRVERQRVVRRSASSEASKEECIPVQKINSIPAREHEFRTEVQIPSIEKSLEAVSPVENTFINYGELLEQMKSTPVTKKNIDFVDPLSSAEEKSEFSKPNYDEDHMTFDSVIVIGEKEKTPNKILIRRKSIQDIIENNEKIALRRRSCDFEEFLVKEESSNEDLNEKVTGISDQISNRRKSDHEIDLKRSLEPTGVSNSKDNILESKQKAPTSRGQHFDKILKDKHSDPIYLQKQAESIKSISDVSNNKKDILVQKQKSSTIKERSSEKTPQIKYRGPVDQNKDLDNEIQPIKLISKVSYPEDICPTQKLKSPLQNKHIEETSKSKCNESLNMDDNKRPKSISSNPRLFNSKDNISAQKLKARTAQVKNIERATESKKSDLVDLHNGGKDQQTKPIESASKICSSKDSILAQMLKLPEKETNSKNCDQINPQIVDIDKLFPSLSSDNILTLEITSDENSDITSNQEKLDVHHSRVSIDSAICIEELDRTVEDKTREIATLDTEQALYSIKNNFISLLYIYVKYYEMSEQVEQQKLLGLSPDMSIKKRYFFARHDSDLSNMYKTLISVKVNHFSVIIFFDRLAKLLKEEFKSYKEITEIAIIFYLRRVIWNLLENFTSPSDEHYLFNCITSCESAEYVIATNDYKTKYATEVDKKMNQIFHGFPYRIGGESVSETITTIPSNSETPINITIKPYEPCTRLHQLSLPVINMQEKSPVKPNPPQKIRGRQPKKLKMSENRTDMPTIQKTLPKSNDKSKSSKNKKKQCLSTSGIKKNNLSRKDRNSPKRLQMTEDPTKIVSKSIQHESEGNKINTNSTSSEFNTIFENLDQNKSYLQINTQASQVVTPVIQTELNSQSSIQNQEKSKTGEIGILDIVTTEPESINPTKYLRVVDQDKLKNTVNSFIHTAGIIIAQLDGLHSTENVPSIQEKDNNINQSKPNNKTTSSISQFSQMVQNIGVQADCQETAQIDSHFSSKEYEIDGTDPARPNNASINSLPSEKNSNDNQTSSIPSHQSVSIGNSVIASGNIPQESAITKDNSQDNVGHNNATAQSIVHSNISQCIVPNAFNTDIISENISQNNAALQSTIPNCNINQSLANFQNRSQNSSSKGTSEVVPEQNIRTQINTVEKNSTTGVLQHNFYSMVSDTNIMTNNRNLLPQNSSTIENNSQVHNSPLPTRNPSALVQVTQNLSVDIQINAATQSIPHTGLLNINNQSMQKNFTHQLTPSVSQINSIRGSQQSSEMTSRDENIDPLTAFIQTYCPESQCPVSQEGHTSNTHFRQFQSTSTSNQILNTQHQNNTASTLPVTQNNSHSLSRNHPYHIPPQIVPNLSNDVIENSRNATQIVNEPRNSQNLTLNRTHNLLAYQNQNPPQIIHKKHQTTQNALQNMEAMRCCRPYMRADMPQEVAHNLSHNSAQFMTNAQSVPHQQFLNRPLEIGHQRPFQNHTFSNKLQYYNDPKIQRNAQNYLVRNGQNLQRRNIPFERQVELKNMEQSHLRMMNIQPPQLAESRNMDYTRQRMMNLQPERLTNMQNVDQNHHRMMNLPPQRQIESRNLQQFSSQNREQVTLQRPQFASHNNELFEREIAQFMQQQAYQRALLEAQRAKYANQIVEQSQNSDSKRKSIAKNHKPPRKQQSVSKTSQRRPGHSNISPPASKSLEQSNLQQSSVSNSQVVQSSSMQPQVNHLKRSENLPEDILMRRSETLDNPNDISTQAVQGVLRNASRDSGYLSPLDAGHHQLPEINYCSRCLESTNLICSGCNIFYCSVECQQLAWPEHRHFCYTVSDK